MVRITIFHHQFGRIIFWVTFSIRIKPPQNPSNTHKTPPFIYNIKVNIPYLRRSLGLSSKALLNLRLEVQVPLASLGAQGGDGVGGWMLTGGFSEGCF